jgi:hypothetical protein
MRHTRPSPGSQLTLLATLSPQERGEGKEDYAASALAPFSAGVIAPEPLISATSEAE